MAKQLKLKDNQKKSTFHQNLHGICSVFCFSKEDIRRLNNRVNKNLLNECEKMWTSSMIGKIKQVYYQNGEGLPSLRCRDLRKSHYSLMGVWN